MYIRHMYPTMPATARSPPGTLGETLIRDPADKSDGAESALVVRAVGLSVAGAPPRRVWSLRRNSTGRYRRQDRADDSLGTFLC